MVKRPIQQIGKPVLWRAWGVATLVLLFAPFAQAQTMQYLFDVNGNLVSESEAIGTLPQIIRQPQNRVVAPGDVASFSVLVADTRGLSYQWHFNGNPIIGATTETLLRRDFTTSDEGQYTVVLVNPSGSVTSAPAMLMLDTDEDGLADSWEQTYFGSLAQYSATDYDGDGLSNLTEFLDGTNPTDGASAIFRLTVMSDGGQITVTPSRFQFTNGETVTLTATAFPPHGFHAWAGEIESTNNPITLTMTNNKSIFAYLSSYDITWVSGISGNWFTLANWSPRVIPLSNDNVFLTERGVTTTNNGNAVCRSFTLGGPTANATLTGTGDLTVLSHFSWGQGTMSGSGRTVIPPNASLNISGALNHVLSGGRTLENSGTIVLSGSSLTMGSATITNRAGAVFDCQTAVTIGVGGVNQFDNAGTFRKSISSGTATWPVAFNNSGVVEIQTGRLALNGSSGTHSGRFEIAAGASLNFSSGGGTQVADAASIITGDGDLIVSGNVIATLAGLVNPTGAHIFSGGTVNLNGTYICTNNPVTISGATANFNGASTVARVNLSNGNLGGTAVLTVMDTMNWSGGSMIGSGRTIIASGASLNLINAATEALNTRTLENGGTVIWTGAGNLNVNFAVITNRAGALFELRNNATFVLQAGSSRFDNAGTLRKAIAGGTSTFGSGFPLNNYGTAEIQAGTLLFSASCTNRGAFSLSPGTTLRFAGGGSSLGSFTAPPTALVDWTANAFTLNPGAQLNGAGLYKINVGSVTLTCNTNVAVENLDLLGILNGTGIVTVSNVMNWTSGTMGGSGRTLIAPGARLNLNNSGTMMLQRTLENAGTTLWTGGTITMDSSVITNRNGALFHAQNAATLMQRSGVNRFDNAGTFRKSGNTGTTTLTTLVNFNNYNTVELMNGILAANGAYTSAPNAVLYSFLNGTNAGTGFGQLRIAGTLTLNGSLQVDLAEAFTPAVNDTFAVLTAGTRNGTFANFLYPSGRATMQMSNAPNAVIVRVTGLVTPPPTLLVPEITGSNVLLTWTAVSNAVYRLEFTGGLGATNWNSISGDVTASSNRASALDSATTTNRFYRIRVLQ